MRIPIRLAHALALSSCSLALAACASSDITSLTPLGSCPAAAATRVSADLVPGAASATVNGCAHRTAIEVPLAQVIDLNDAGEVLGAVTVTAPTQLAVWSKGGTRLLTPPPGAAGVWGVDLNNNGMVVGCGAYAAPPSGPPPSAGSLASHSLVTPPNAGEVCHVVVWDAQGVGTDLGLLDPAATEARADAINDAGDIVGTLIYANGSRRAFLRSAAGTLTFIPVTALHSEAVALNERGDVTGWYTDGSEQSGPFRTFVWSQAAGFTDVGDLAVASGAQASLRPNAINESGEVLGTLWAKRSPTSVERASTFLYSRALGLRDIGSLSGFQNAVSLNDQGEILGWATVSDLFQPTTWAVSRPDQLPVRFEWAPPPSGVVGGVLQINNWNEVLDTFIQPAGVTHNVVWTWNPERYR